MSNIVERLRKGDPCGDCKRDRCACVIMEDAADEIERLRAEANDLCPIDAMDRGMTPVEAAIWHVWGERCSDFEPECLTCRAWAEFDENERLRAVILKVTAALNEGRIVPRGGVSGMTIEAQLRNSVYTGVPAWPIEEAREMLDEITVRAALSDTQPEQVNAMRLNIDDERFLAAIDREGDHEIGAGNPAPEKGAV